MAETVIVKSGDNINREEIRAATSAVDLARKQERYFTIEDKDLTKYIEEMNREKGKTVRELAEKIKSQNLKTSPEVAKENLQNEDEREI